MNEAWQHDSIEGILRIQKLIMGICLTGKHVNKPDSEGTVPLFQHCLGAKEHRLVHFALILEGVILHHIFF